jgi:hypothetical protein
MVFGAFGNSLLPTPPLTLSCGSCSIDILAETKNGSVIRKHIGRNHIPKKNALTIENFYEKYFNPYLNKQTFF